MNNQLHEAVQRGDFDEVLRLVSKGASLDSLSEEGEDLLSQAVNVGAAFVSLVLSIGASPNQRSLTGRTCLYQALVARDLEVFNLLVAKGAKLDADQPADQYTLLHQSAEMGLVKFIEPIVKGTSPGLINAFDNFARTPLMCSVAGGSLSAASLLLKLGVNINCQDKARSGDTALILAVKTKNSQMVNLLLEYGANVGAQGWMKMTALDHCLEEDNVSQRIRRMIQSAGSGPTAVNN